MERATAMQFSAYFLYRTACFSRERAKAATNDSLVQAFDALASITEAAMTVEAFINEFGEFLDTMLRHDPIQQKELIAVADTLTLLEQDHPQLSLKYLLTSSILGKPFDKGKNPFQDFKILVDVRNLIAHCKPRGKFFVENFQHKVEYPSLVVNLQNRGLARKTDSILSSWLIVLLTPEMAEWACESALKIILSVLDMVQDPCTLQTFVQFREDPLTGKYSFNRLRGKAAK